MILPIAGYFHRQLPRINPALVVLRCWLHSENDFRPMALAGFDSSTELDDIRQMVAFGGARALFNGSLQEQLRVITGKTGTVARAGRVIGARCPLLLPAGR